MTVKHTPSTDALETLGNIIHPGEKRDAIHLAVDPAFSAGYLNPGDHVRIVGKNQVERCAVGAGHGIVDPFLRRSVNPGEWFWLVVYPREITSLRHVWSHPAFEEEPKSPHPMPDFAASDPQLKPFSAKRGSDELAKAAMMTSMVSSVDSEDAATIEKSRQWVLRFANGLDLDYDELMDAASDYLDCGEYLVKGGDLEGCSVPDEFWDHYQIIKEEKIDENDRGSFFSCSC